MLKGQTLVFDADDTLWENNVLFERVIEGFLDWVSGPEDRTRTRVLLDEIEARNAVTLGYGAGMFRQSLRECLEALNGRTPTNAENARVEDLLTPLTNRRIELIEGVEETLLALSADHELLLLTKGNLEEQRRKVDASRIAHHFRGIHIVPEKNVDTYRQLSAGLGLEAERMWMIGNSPKSDILPALRAGLKTVYIPHEHTWVLEHDEFRPEEATLVLRTFAELLDHF
ncbi:HAD hydrolase-like protein [Streptacidiphilus sp. ASG 303]|uniref:HAD family hydrolase n=1 Tax=Streptacidiphilus sp. ASG 303 TaxID=2896847 RepID=UPI001E609826|nr:HAD family hydrolase [Streptacidiphilus sp. ASG 303]MCD0485897.1 HAD hydrolase-like protein [Streptacidiphilus sp. ASG 303]